MKMLIYLKEILALLPFDEISIPKTYVQNVSDSENISKISNFLI